MSRSRHGYTDSEISCVFANCFIHLQNASFYINVSTRHLSSQNLEKMPLKAQI